MVRAEASSDNAATRTAGFLRSAVYLVFKAGGLHSSVQGWAPSTCSSLELSAGECSPKAEGVTASDMVLLTKITMRPCLAGDLPGQVAVVHHLTAQGVPEAPGGMVPPQPHAH